jgi:serine/threonine protein kinase
MLTNGSVLHDRYRIVHQIGCGGMGAVYEALDSRLENTVAVKQCRSPGVDAGRAFEHEAKLLATLRHRALPTVIDYFVEGDEQFLVMQFIEGDDLGKLLDHRRDRFTPGEVVAWAQTVLDALCYLHDHVPPVVHRDIKPSNLRRTPRGEITLLDFGIAKGRLRDSATPPADRSVFGYTLSYSPLEQILGRSTDPRSDVYAVGATLYHLLTGLPPVNALERMRAVESGAPDPLHMAHGVEAGVPEHLSRLIARAMALDPADRYASAREMKAALNGCDADETTRVTPPDHRGESRRIDAAVPNRAEVGRPVDLLVQVRFAGSPRLGVEDWPSKERPTVIEQISETLQLVYPTDLQTGRLLPARLRIKVVAPDCRVENQTDRLIEVPPDEYSKRLAFLLTPLRTGYCRINVEVYGLDDLFLGTVAVELTAVAATASEREIGVGNLVLDGVARQVAALLLGAGVATAASPASLAAAQASSAAITRLNPPGVPTVTRSAPQSEGSSPLTPSVSLGDTETFAGRPVPGLFGAGSSKLDGLANPSAFDPALSMPVERASNSAPFGGTGQKVKHRLLRTAMLTGPLAVVVFVATILLNTRVAHDTPAPEYALPAPQLVPGATPEPPTAPVYATDPPIKPVTAPTPALVTPPTPPPASAPEPARPTPPVPEPKPAAPVDTGELARANAVRLVAQARTLARSDVVSAVKMLREAETIDPKVEGAAELTTALQNQLVEQGELALASARIFDGYKRTTEAIKEFDRAVQFLELVAGGHKDLAFAKRRSAELKALR